jgi:hypothetical protein
MQTSSRWAIVARLGLCALAILVGILLGWYVTWRDELIYSFKHRLQDGHTVSIWRYGIEPSPWLFVTPHYSMRIYAVDTYHEVDIPECAPFDVEKCLSRSVLLETVHGLSFTQPSGHRIFIPREMYVGGR